MLDIPSVSSIVAAIGVILDVAFTYWELRSIVRQRETDIETSQAQLFMQIYGHYYTEDFLNDENEILFRWKWKDFDDFWQKRARRQAHILFIKKQNPSK